MAYKSRHGTHHLLAHRRKDNSQILASLEPATSRSQVYNTMSTFTMSDKAFHILQWNANGIGNKQTEQIIFLEAHNVKVAAIQESKLTAQSRSPNIQINSLVRQDRRLCPGGDLLFFIHNSVIFTRKPLSTTSKNDPHLDELTIIIAMDNTEFIVPNLCILQPAPAMGIIQHHSTTCPQAQIH